MAAVKRARSDSDASEYQSDDQSDSLESRRVTYADPGYRDRMEVQRVFLRASELGPLPDEVEDCKALLTSDEPVPPDWVFDTKLNEFAEMVRDGPELRVYMDVHHRLVPSAAILNLESGKFGNLREGCNNQWIHALPFDIDMRLPQPDRTVGHDRSQLTDDEQREIESPSALFPSVFGSFPGAFFPFLTCEVAGGLQDLETVRNANANSMAVALRGMVELYRRAGMAKDIHRKIMGISICHNAIAVELNGHYPEIDGGITSYYQCCISSFDYIDNYGADRYTCYKFVRNVYSKFAPTHLKRIRAALARLPGRHDPRQVQADEALNEPENRPDPQSQTIEPNPEFRKLFTNMEHLTAQVIAASGENKELRQEISRMIADNNNNNKQIREELERLREENRKLRGPNRVSDYNSSAN